jgi:hypothetical protein
LQYGGLGTATLDPSKTYKGMFDGIYKIAKYAMELYKMVDQFEGQGEVDFPAWWQSKITQACSMVSSAKHYLEFELTEPEIDSMVRSIDYDSDYEN